VARLRYTRAVIDETLRLYPPVPILAREALEDEAIRNRPVPKGSLVMVVPWLIHRHKLLWDKPDHFWPERFMPGGPGAKSKVLLRALRHRAPHLRRAVVWANGGDPFSRHAGAALLLAAQVRPRRRADLAA
jgi:cytochrome P450